MNSSSRIFPLWWSHPRVAIYLLAAGLLGRLIYLLLLSDLHLEGDAEQYHLVANQWAAGNQPEPYWPPGLPAYLAAWKSIFGFSQAAARWAMFPWFGLLLWGCSRLFRQLLSPEKAHFLFLILIVYPEWWMHSAEPLSQLPVAALLVLGWNAVVDRVDTGRLLLAGVCLGLAVCVRPSTLLLALVWPALQAWRIRSFKWLLPVVPVLGIVLGTSLYLSSVHERPILLNDANSRNIYLGNNAWTHWYKSWDLGSHWTMSPDNPEGFREELAALEEVPLEQRSGAYLKASKQHVLNDPGAFAVRTLSRMRTFWAFDSGLGARQLQRQNRGRALLVLGGNAFLFCLVLGLAIRGLWTVQGRLRWVQTMTFAALLLYAFPYFISFSHPTYHLAIFPLLLLLAGCGMSASSNGFSWKMGLSWGLLFLLQVEWVWQMAP